MGNTPATMRREPTAVASECISRCKNCRLARPYVPVPEFCVGVLVPFDQHSYPLR
jgi:hypothetical protein